MSERRVGGLPCVYVIVAPMLLVALCGCGKVARVDGVYPRKGEIRESFSEPARTRLAKIYPVTAPVSGLVERISLEPGDRVKKGQVLAKYDLVPFRQRVAEARAVVAELEAEIAVKDDNKLEQTAMKDARLTIQASKESLKAAEAQVDAERARVSRANVELERMKKLAAKKNVSQSRLDDANLLAETSLMELRKQEFTRSALNTFVVATELWPQFIERYLGRKKLERKTLVHKLTQAKARLVLAEHELTLATVVSPIDGIVLERYEQGDAQLPAGRRLLLLGNLDQLEVVAEVLTQDAMRLSPGSEVSLTPAVGFKTIPGRVKRIEPAGFTKRSSLGVEQQRVNVIVSFAGPHKGLGVGFRLQARFFTGANPDAIVVPRFSVLQAADQSFYVFKIAGGRLKRQPVKLGLRNDLELEVTDGLSQRDMIVRQPDATMKDGMTVKVTNRPGAANHDTK